MAERMTHEQYVTVIREQILNAAKGILNKTVDTTTACYFICQYWHQAEFLIDTDEHNFSRLLDDDLEQFIESERNIYQPLDNISDEEQSVLDFYEKAIVDWCQRIIDYISNHE